ELLRCFLECRVIAVHCVGAQRHKPREIDNRAVHYYMTISSARSVSNSPWNLFDFLKEFLKLHKYPLGPLLLRDLGTPNQRIFTREPHHKTAVIRKILETYPQLKFLLIGDSGERDPHIYSQIREEFPGRILGTYIREIKGGKWQKNDKQQHIFTFRHFKEAQQQLQDEDWFFNVSQEGK
ncbi:MAG: App1 family protein, partial [Bacteroidota bacterium]